MIFTKQWNQERKKKENNLIIFGLKESQNIDATARKSEDEAMLTQLFKSLKVGNVGK